MQSSQSQSAADKPLSQDRPTEPQAPSSECFPQHHSIETLLARVLHEKDAVQSISALLALDELQAARQGRRLTSFEPNFFIGLKPTALDEASKRITTGALLRFAREVPAVLAALSGAIDQKTERPDAIFSVLAEFPAYADRLPELAERICSSWPVRSGHPDRPVIFVFQEQVGALLDSFPIGPLGLPKLSAALKKELSADSDHVSQTTGLLAGALREKFGILDSELETFAERCKTPRADILLALADSEAAVPMIEPALRAQDASLNYAALVALELWCEYISTLPDICRIKEAFLELAARDSKSPLMRKSVQRIGLGYDWIAAPEFNSLQLDYDELAERLEGEADAEADAGQTPAAEPTALKPARTETELLAEVEAYQGEDRAVLADQIAALTALPKPYSDSVLHALLKAASHPGQITGIDSPQVKSQMDFYHCQYQVADLLSKAPNLPATLAEPLAKFHSSSSSVTVSANILAAAQRFGLWSRSLAASVARNALWANKAPFYSGVYTNVAVDRFALRALYDMGLDAEDLVPSLTLKTLCSDSIAGLQALAVIANIRNLQRREHSEQISLDTLSTWTHDRASYRRRDNNDPAIAERLLVSALSKTAQIDPEVRRTLLSVIDGTLAKTGHLSAFFWNGENANEIFLCGRALGAPQVLFPVLTSFLVHCPLAIRETVAALEAGFHENSRVDREAKLSGKLRQVKLLTSHLPACPSAKKNIAAALEASSSGALSQTKILLACQVAEESSELTAWLYELANSADEFGAAVLVGLPRFKVDGSRIIELLRSDEADARFAGLHLLQGGRFAKAAGEEAARVRSELAKFYPKNPAEESALARC